MNRCESCSSRSVDVRNTDASDRDGMQLISRLQCCGQVRYSGPSGNARMRGITADCAMLRDGTETRRVDRGRTHHSVSGAFFDVYNTLGYGFLEHAYAMALERELLARGHRVGREVSVNIAYKEITLTSQRLDFVVDERLVVETKSTKPCPRSRHASSITISGQRTLRLACCSISGPNQSSTAWSLRRPCRIRHDPLDPSRSGVSDSQIDEPAIRIDSLPTRVHSVNRELLGPQTSRVYRYESLVHQVRRMSGTRMHRIRTIAADQGMRES